MARSVSVILTANADPYIAAMLKADAANTRFEKSTMKSSATIEAAFKSQGQSAQRANQRLIASLRAEEAEMAKAAKAAQKYGATTAALNGHKEQLSQLAGGMAKFGLAAGAAFGIAVVAAANFDQSMSRVQAAFGGSTKDMSQLRDLAIVWGQKTQYSATEAADGITQLAKAGVSAKDILAGGLQGALNLAASGQMDVGAAAEDAASAMNQFSLAGKDVPHIADLLAAAAGKAQGEVSDMALALKYVGPVASQMGVSIEQTTGAIAELASNGILADQAGTGLRGVLASLTSPSKKAADEMKNLGINMYDTSGNFIGFDGVAQQLHDHLGKLSNAQRDAALGVIFGNQQITAARVLYAGGAAAVDKWTNSVNDSGFAARSAQTKMNNLKGDIEQLRGALETALIGAGEGQQGPLRQAVEGLTKLVNAWSDLPDSVKAAVTRIVGVMGLLSLGGAATIKVMQGVAAMRKAMVDMGGASGPIKAFQQLKTGVDEAGAALTNAGRAARLAQIGVPAVGLALVGVTAAIGYFQDQQAKEKAVADDFSTAMDTITGKINTQSAALNKNVQQVAIKNLTDADAYKNAKTLGLSYNDVTQAALGNEGAQRRVAAAIGAADDAQRSANTAAGGYTAATSAQTDAARNLDHVLFGTNKSMQDGISKAKQARDASDAAAKAQQNTAQTTESLGKKFGLQAIETQQAAGASRQLKTDQGQLKTAQDDLNQATQKLITNFTILKGGALDLDQASDQFKGTLGALKDAEKQNGKTLDSNTEKGRANKQAIRDAISAMNDNIGAQFKSESQTKGLKQATDDASHSLRQQRQDLIDAADKAGYNRDQVKKMVDQMVLTPKELKTQVNAYGIDDLRKQIQKLQDEIDKLKGVHKVQLDYSVTANGTLVKGSKLVPVHGGPDVANSHADGGYIAGPGGPTDDKIPSWLSNGEYVLRASAVRRMGKMRLDYLNATGEIPKFRDGGLVNSGGLNTGGNGALGSAVVPNITLSGSIAEGAVQAVISALATTTDNINQAAAGYFQSVVEGMYSTGLIGGGQFEKALAFARSQAGKPYVWAAAGPNGYDCSGFMGAIQNVIDGDSPYHRRWSTSAFQGQSQAQGFTKNADSAFKIGVTNAGVGHTAGTINGVNVESRGGAGVIVGPKARGWDDPLFPMHYGLTAGMAGKAGVGGSAANEHVTGSNQQIFRKLMLIAGYPAADWSMVDYIISHESSWNLHNRNPKSGAYGLPQALPGSKMAAYGPDWQDSAATQANFFFHYIKDQYGGLPGAYDFWRAHHYYATGGPISGPGTGTSDDIPAWLSNGEYVINARSTAKHKPLLDMINADKYASGGVVGYGSSSQFNVSAIVKMITTVSDPISDLVKATKALKEATEKNGAGLSAATRAYNAAEAAQKRLRLTNATQTEQARARVANASADVTSAKLALQKLEPDNSKIGKAQSVLTSAESSLSTKQRSDAEAIAKLNDRIAAAKKGSVTYENLLTEKQLKEKSNTRDIATAQAKVNAARKAADKAGVNTDKITKAEKRLTDAENALTRARAHQSAVSRDNALQTTKASVAVSAAKAKVDALKTASDNLAQAEQAIVDSANQVSSAFSDAYLSKSTAVADWLQSMKIGTSDITKLNSQVKQLRSMGLSETLIQQIIGIGQNQGAPGASAIAASIISGGKKTITSLDKAAKGLSDAADKLGYTSATGKYAGGGPVWGSGNSTSDSISARLSNGEYVVNAAATARNRRVLDAINYGGHSYMRYAGGGYVGGGISKADLIDAITAVVDARPLITGNQIGSDPREIVRELDMSRRRNMHRVGIGVRR